MTFRRRTTTVAWLVASFALVVGACTATMNPSADELEQPPADPDSPPAGDTLAGGTLRYGLEIDPVTIDPRFVVDDEGELIVNALFDPLVRLDADLQPIPAAAADWETEGDGRVFTFHLREAEFHDGTPVTAEDFRRTFTRIVDNTAQPPSFLSYLLAPIEGFESAQSGEAFHGIEVVDDRTLVIRLREPQPGFIATLANPSLVPVPPAADADPQGFALEPIGNGPFQMAEPRELETFLRLSRYPDHHRPAMLDEVVFQVYPGDQGRQRQWEDLLSGQLQVAGIPAVRMREAAERFGESPDGYRGPGLLGGTTSAAYLYAFDTTTAPFDDPRVRRAISMAIDRETLAEDVLLGARVAASAIIPPSILGSQPGACGHCRYDPEAAAELFSKAMASNADDAVAGDGDGSGEDNSDEEDGTAGDVADGDQQDAPPSTSLDDHSEASIGDGLNGGEEAPAAAAAAVGENDEGQADGVASAAEEPTLDSLMLTHNRGEVHTAIAESMAADIESALDIEVEFRARGLQSFVQAVRDGDVPFFRLGWDGDAPHPDAYLYPLFHSSQTDSDNLMRYADDEVDALLDLARANSDRAEALEQYQEAERLILEDAPALPLLWYREVRVVAPEVQNFRLSPLGRVPFNLVRIDADA